MTARAGVKKKMVKNAYDVGGGSTPGDFGIATEHLLEFGDETCAVTGVAAAAVLPGTLELRRGAAGEDATMIWASDEANLNGKPSQLFEFSPEEVEQMIDWNLTPMKDGFRVPQPQTQAAADGASTPRPFVGVLNVLLRPDATAAPRMYLAISGDDGTMLRLRTQIAMDRCKLSACDTLKALIAEAVRCSAAIGGLREKEVLRRVLLASHPVRRLGSPEAEEAAAEVAAAAAAAAEEEASAAASAAAAEEDEEDEEEGEEEDDDDDEDEPGQVFSEGDKVEALYMGQSKGLKWYLGMLLKPTSRTEAGWSVKYDDGDEEEHVRRTA